MSLGADRIWRRQDPDLGRGARPSRRQSPVAVSLEVGYHPVAAAEVVRAAAWYENETAGLGDRFLDAVEASALRVSRWPNVGKQVVIAPDGAVVNRKLPVGGFPWAIGYEVTDKKLVVLALFHQHREPEYWTDRANG